MSHKSEWKKKAEKLLETNTAESVTHILFEESKYRDRIQFRKKIGLLERLLKTKSTAIKAVKEFVGGEYKEVRDESGKTTITEIVDRKLTDDELYERYGRSRVEWKISMVWFKDRQNGFLLSCCFLPIQKTANNSIDLTQDFIKKLDKIKPIEKSSLLSKKQDKNLPKCFILIPKQDSHLNKFDIGGDNSIEARFDNFKARLINQLSKTSLTNQIDEIKYIVGSDEFNSEWTGQTTKGTPQQNILSHQEGFEKITDFNIEIIKLLCTFSANVNVVLLNGNHDHNVGWHLANVLKRVFKNCGVNVDDSMNNTKVFSWDSNLILMNHGDELKPKDLAARFPTIANDMWSNHSNYFVITGDKHHEIAHDFHGIMTYQVPQLSNAKSAWDDKKVHTTSKAEMMTFVFEAEGLVSILRNKM